MEIRTRLATLISTAVFYCVLVLLLPAVAATPTTEREKRDCSGDYHRYCSDYGLGTEALRACMSRNIRKVSNACVAALVDAGEMTQAQANKLRHKAKTTKKPTHKRISPRSATKNY